MVEGNVDGVDVIFDGKDTGCASGGGTPRGGKKALGNFNACLKEGVDSVLFGAVLCVHGQNVCASVVLSGCPLYRQRQCTTLEDSDQAHGVYLSGLRSEMQWRVVWYEPR